MEARDEVSRLGIVTLILLFVVVIVAYDSVFTVPQTEPRPGRAPRRAGHALITGARAALSRTPFVDTVIYVDNRILDLESASEEVIASDQKRLVVEAFARYRIGNPLQFYQTVGTIDGANSRLSPLLNSALRRVLGDFTLTQVLRDERHGADGARPRPASVTEAQTATASPSSTSGSAAPMLPKQNSQAVYQHVQTERRRGAAEFRAQGSQKHGKSRSTPTVKSKLSSWPRRIQRRADPRRGRCRA